MILCRITPPHVLLLYLGWFAILGDYFLCIEHEIKPAIRLSSTIHPPTILYTIVQLSCKDTFLFQNETFMRADRLERLNYLGQSFENVQMLKLIFGRN